MTGATTVKSAFLANMRALARCDSALALRLSSLAEDALLPLEAARSGVATARVVNGDGKTIYLHSRHDPIDEASRFCRSVEPTDAMCAVLCGLGLGYHARALLDQGGPDAAVIVCEPDIVTIRSALECTDLTVELAAGRIVFLTSDDKNELHAKLNRIATLMTLGTRFVVPPPARALNADFHSRLRSQITDFTAMTRMSLLTLVANSRITCENIAGNLPVYLATPTVDVLRDRYRGRPAILVSAGPSLERNIDLLHRAEGRAVIIAVQTMLKPLLARQIRPDFVTTLDFSDLSRRFFDGVEDFGQTIMVAEPKASPAVVDAFRAHRDAREARVILLNNEFAQRCAGPELAARNGLKAGSTVAHLSLYLAEHLGCDPIILVGQDLGFTGGVYYCPGVAIHDAWQPELGRFCSLEQKEWERIARHRPILRRVNDVNGESIYTDEQMFSYLEQFERDFAACKSTIIDATEGGVLKRGAETMSFATAIERYCPAPLPAEANGWKQSVGWYEPARLKSGRAAMVDRCDRLIEFRRLCEETRDVLAELADAVENAARFNRLIVRVDDLRRRVREHDVVFRLVCDVSQLAELQKFSADRRLAAEGVRGMERAKRQLDRDRRFMAALLDGCDALRRIFDIALARFDDEITMTPSAVNSSAPIAQAACA